MTSRRTFLTAVPVTATLLALPGTALAGDRPPRGPRPQQSPIALRSRRAEHAPELPRLVVDYPREVEVSVRYVSRDPDDPSGCSTRGREETVEAAVPPGSASIRLGRTRYELEQFHFHTPSEHVLDGHRFPVEQHLVHRGPDGRTLVVGLFLTAGGRGGTAQDRVLERLPQECADEVPVAGIDLARSLPRDLSTFRYRGSLTTSPNTEGVSWLVLRRHRSIATATVEGFRSLFPDGDARDLQPLAGRVVALREQ